VITTRLAWQGLGTSARNTLAWARGLYQAARVPRGAASAARLEHAQWLSTSAEACVGEAQRLYLEGLESLLRSGVSVQRQDDVGRVRFACRAVDGTAADLVQFENGQPDTAEPAVLERLFVSAEEKLLRVFGRGLIRLDALGAFNGTEALELRPDPQARTPRQNPAEAPRRRAGAASVHFRKHPPAPPPPLPLRQT